MPTHGPKPQLCPHGVLERVVEKHLVERVEALNGLCLKFISPGQRGAPDRLVVLPGFPTYYVELKRPRTGKLSELQKRFHDRLRDRGQGVWVLWSKEDVDAFLVKVESLLVELKA